MADLLGTPLFWRIYATVYDALWDDAHTSAVAEAVVELLREIDPTPAPLVEIGSGTGLVTSHLRSAGYQVVPTEPVEAMRRRFRRRLPEEPVRAVSVEEIIEGIPDIGSDGPLVAVNVIHLTSDPDAVLDGLVRLARPHPVVVATPVPGVGVAALARAKRRAGVSWWKVMRFVGLQALLVPIIALIGPRRGTDRRPPIGLTRTPEVTVGGCVAIHVWGGVGRGSGR